MVGNPLRRDLLYLYVAQAANIIFPLITVPFLARVLGPESFGFLAVGQALAVYLQLVIEYGFSYSAAREVTRFGGDRENIKKVLDGVLGAKVLLFFITVVLGYSVYLVVPFFKHHSTLVFASLSYAFAEVLNPYWLYRGLGRVRVLAFLIITTRLLSFASILTFVRDPSQYALPIFLNGLSNLLPGVLGYVVFMWKESGFWMPSLSGALVYLSQGFKVFVYENLSVIRNTINPFLLAFLLPAKEVGLFASAERMVQPLMGFLVPLISVFLPRLVKIASEDKEIAKRMVGSLAMSVLSVGLLMVGGLIAFGDLLISVVFGTSYLESGVLLKILALAVFLSSVVVILGNIWCVALGLDRILVATVVIGGVAQVGLIWLFAKEWGPTGAAWGVVLARLTDIVYLLMRLAIIKELPVVRGRTSVG